MKLKYEIFNQQTANTIDKLTKLPVSKYKNMKIFLFMMKLKVEYDREKKPFDIAESNLIWEYCDKDEHDKPIVGPKNQFSFIQKRNEFQEKHDELLSQEVELHLEPIVIKISEEEKLFKKEEICTKCKEKFKDEVYDIITPNDMAALFGIIEFCE